MSHGESSSPSLEESWHSRSPGCIRIITPPTPPRPSVGSPAFQVITPSVLAAPPNATVTRGTSTALPHRPQVAHTTRLESHHSLTSASLLADPQRRSHHCRPRILLRLVLVLGRRYRIHRTVLLLLLLLITRTELIPAASITRKGRMVGRRLAFPRAHVSRQAHRQWTQIVVVGISSDPSTSRGCTDGTEVPEWGMTPRTKESLGLTD
jgi:hypothetical protein